MPEVKKMTTRRSARNLQQLSTQSQNVQSDEEPVRDYELNCGRAMKKKAKTCSVDYLVTGEEKGGVTMSTAFPHLCMRFIEPGSLNIFIELKIIPMQE